MPEGSVRFDGVPMTLLSFLALFSVQPFVLVPLVSKTGRSTYLRLTFAIADVVYGGVGYHEAAIAMTAPGKLIIYAKFLMVIPLLYLAAVVFPKLAILAIYLRIFTQPRFRSACYVLITLLIANWIGTTVAGLLICRPLEYLWDRTIVDGHCLNINAYFRWASLVNIITDVAMLILPLPVIWELHTSRNIKIGLTITFATGSM